MELSTDALGTDLMGNGVNESACFTRSCMSSHMHMQHTTVTDVEELSKRQINVDFILVSLNPEVNRKSILKARGGAKKKEI